MTGEKPEARRPFATVKPVTVTAGLLALLTAALWGGTPVAIRYTTDTLPPVMVAGIRFALAAVFMLFWCRWEGSELRIRKGQWRPILIVGGLLFFQIALFNVGVAESNASHGSLFINTFIFWVAAIEHFITRADQLTPRKLAGLLLAGTAAIMVVLFGTGSPQDATAGQDQPTAYGDLILIASGCLLGIKIVCTKEATRVVEPGKLIFWHDIVGTVMFFAWSGLFETTHVGDFTMPAIWGLLYQGVVVAGFCFALQAVLLKRYSASQISVFSSTTPVWGVALGVFFRGDAITVWLLGAGLCIATGIWLVSLAPRTQK